MPTTKKRKQGPDTANAYICPNPLCHRTFTTQQGRTNHFQHYSQCSAMALSILARPTASAAKMADPCVDTDSEENDDMAFDFDAAYPDEGVDATAGPAAEAPIAVVAAGGFTQAHVVVHQTGVTYTVDEHAELSLLKMTDDANVPHFLYKDILDWAADAHARGYNFQPDRTSRAAQILSFEKRFSLQNCRPQHTTIMFPEDNLRIEITHFEFFQQLHSLLTDKALTGDLTQLDVPQDNPFGKYVSPNGRLGPFNSGSWYDNTWDRLCTKPNDWLCPIVYGCDETIVGSSQGRASVTPLLFTLSIFNEHLRNKRTSWRPLGYVYDLAQHGKGMHSAGRTVPRILTPEEKCSRYHRMLDTILASHLAVQTAGGIPNSTIELGACRADNLNVITPVGIILGDMQGGDKHCGSKIGYSKDQARLCRQCNVSGDESGDPLVKCRKMSMWKIRQYVLDNEVETLKSISQNNVYTAWFRFDFGGCELGVFSAAMPVEALHAVEGGLMKYVAKILYEVDLKKSMCGQLDILVSGMCQLDRQYFMASGGNKKMPRLLFKDGVTSLANLPCSHVVGVLLTIVVVSLTDAGKALFEKAFSAPSKDRRVGVKRLNDMRYVFSMLLSYWSWLKQDYFWKCGDRPAQNKAEWAIRKMLEELMKLWPRAEGNGWFTAKIHEQGHVAGDIARNGSPRNTYSGPLEHTHLNVKEDARRTQMNRSVLDAQLANRSAESHIIKYAYDRICVAHERVVDPGPPDAPRVGGSRGVVVFKRGTGRDITTSFCWKLGTNMPPEERACHAIRDAIRHRFAASQDPGLIVTCAMHTEYRREGVIFRAHPEYRSRHPWYDWVMFRYAKSELDIARNRTYQEASHTDAVFYGDPPEIARDHHYAPGKILAFVNTGDDHISAVVLCCAFRHIRSGVFSTHWKIEYKDAQRKRPCIMLMDVNAIVRHCLMVPESAACHAYHEIWEKERWASEFV